MDIKLENIRKHFGRGVVALDDVSVSIEPGEFVTILGPSGSGKSTMLGLIAGLTNPTSGTIRIAGSDVTHLPANRRNIGLVFQSYALFPTMNVFDNVAYPLSVRRIEKHERRERVAQALELVHLLGYEKRMPSELSGGQQQRVALARALVFGPDVMLLDEPLGALDRSLREKMQVELKAIQRDVGTTTVMVTHDQEEALSLSDRIVVLNEGRIEQIGTPAELYGRPRTRFVAEFLGLSNTFEGRLASSDDGAYIDVAGTPFPCEPSDFAVGDHVSALLRPERLQLHPGRRSGESLFGVLQQAVFLGSTVRYHVKTDSLIEIVVVSSDQDIKHVPGDEVSVSWDKRDLWIMGGDPHQ